MAAGPVFCRPPRRGRIARPGVTPERSGDSLASCMAMAGRAKRMVAQHLDHPAIGDRPARALHDHAFKFDLQGHQPGEAALNLGQLRARDGVGGGAGLVRIVRKAEEIADRFQRETQIAGVPDEGEPLQRLAAVEPLVAGAAFGLGQNADLLVVADRRHLHPGLRPELSDGQHQIPLEAIVARDIRVLIR